MAEFYQQHETAVTAFEGCPDPTAGKAVHTVAGTQARVCHQLLGPDGQPVNLTALQEAGTSTVLFSGVTCSSRVHAVTLDAADFADSDNGRICFALPPAVERTPGIYQVQLTLRDEEAVPYVGDRFLLSVESSLLTPDKPGPLTLGEVRRALRDYPATNTAWESSEFSQDEILAAIVRPVQTFNETLPRVLRYSPANFPYRSQWLDAAIGHLLKLASLWYLRNSQKLSYGDGKTEDDKDKHPAYAQIAEMHLQRFQAFCDAEQVTANLTRGFSSFGGTFH